nr:uncharacterized protein LOC104088623 [Nicotiana tomentosiformis]
MPSVASLETNDEADIVDDDPLGGSIPSSPLVGDFSDIGREGPGRMCNAQLSDTDVRGELKVVNEKLDKVLMILGEMQNQNESPSKVVESPWYKVTRLQSILRNAPISASKMKKLKYSKKKKPKVDILKPVSEEDKKILCEWFDKKEKFLKNLLTGSYGWRCFEQLCSSNSSFLIF